MKDFNLDFTYLNLTPVQIDIAKELHEANKDEYFAFRFSEMWSDVSDMIRMCRRCIESARKALASVKSDEYDAENKQELLEYIEKSLVEDYQELIKLYEQKEVLWTAEIQLNNYRHGKQIERIRQNAVSNDRGEYINKD
jgi:hypothetical protein